MTYLWCPVDMEQKLNMQTDGEHRTKSYLQYICVSGLTLAKYIQIILFLGLILNII